MMYFKNREIVSYEDGRFEMSAADTKGHRLVKTVEDDSYFHIYHLPDRAQLIDVALLIFFLF